MSSLTITIDRSSLSLDDLVLSGADDEIEYGITEYQPPAAQSRVLYMPDSADIHGSEAIASSEQQAILGFNWTPDRAESETEIQAAYNEVRAAIKQFAFDVTTEVNGAPAETWRADSGSIQLLGGNRTVFDLNSWAPVYSVTIPVYPIAVTP